MINLKSLPSRPGVYIYRNQAGAIIYVGKAINLKKRVSQYFQTDQALGPKTKTLVSQIDSIETRTVTSEIEALVLEASLIKKHRPKYNSLLKDDKSYLYITISKDRLPIVSTARSTNLPLDADIFGPFPNSRAVKSLLQTIRRIFPYYSRKHLPQPCLYCHLGLCPGPDPNVRAYRHTITKIRKVLDGRFRLLQRQLKRSMNQFSINNDFEQALIVRNQLQAIDYVVSGWRSLNSLFENINLPSDRSSQAIAELCSTLKIRSVDRIECFDISQLGHHYFVGSMTVWQNGSLDHSAYRHFKVRTKFTPDDQYMIKEVVYRRLQHPGWGHPSLVVVDGGKPQVSSVSTITTLPLIGLAKKFETIVLKNGDSFVEINLPPNSSALNLLKSLRDEAHRFANRYRRQIMSKSSHES